MKTSFVPNRTLSLDDRFRAQVVLLFSIALVIWAPVYSLLMYGLEPHWNIVISTMGVMVLVGISPILLHRGVSFFVVGNWLAFNVFWEMVFVGALAGYGPPPFYWLAVVPMLALVISGIRSGVFWLLASLLSLGVYYRYLYAGKYQAGHLPRAELACDGPFFHRRLPGCANGFRVLFEIPASLRLREPHLRGLFDRHYEGFYPPGLRGFDARPMTCR